MNCDHGSCDRDVCSGCFDDAITIIKDICRTRGDTPSLMNSENWLNENGLSFRSKLSMKFSAFYKEIEEEAQAEGPDALKQLEDFKTYFRSKLNNGHNS